MQRFACKLRGDIHAVPQCSGGALEQWSNRGTDQSIKTLKRAMYGRASAELLRARMIPLSALPEHEK